MALMAVDLSARTLRHEELHSGTVYGYVLPDVVRFLLAGFFPESVVPLMNEYLRSPLEFIQQEFDGPRWEAWNEARVRLVAWMVRSVDGEAVSFDPKSEVDRALLGDPERFPADDLEGLFLRGLRLRPAPKASKPSEWEKARKAA